MIGDSWIGYCSKIMINSRNDILILECHKKKIKKPRNDILSGCVLSTIVMIGDSWIGYCSTIMINSRNGILILECHLKKIKKPTVDNLP